MITDPARDVDEDNDVRVDGSPVAVESHEVWAVNKPAGVVSTAKEPGERPAVVSLVDSEARLYPVGRLDAESTGLLLLTNDGELANRLTHPRYEVAKIYRAKTLRPPSDRDLERLRRGVDLEDGRTAPAQVTRIADCEIEMVLREGRNRQVRRMVEAVGNKVLGLRRVRFGSLSLGRLALGGCRRLSKGRSPGSGKMRSCERERRLLRGPPSAALRRPRRHTGRGQRGRGDPRGDRRS